MSTLQELLGTDYHDGMTIDEINTAISAKNLGEIDQTLAENYEKVKNANNKFSSEIAEYKRQIKAKMTDDEKKAAELEEKNKEREAHIAELERSVKVSENKAAYIAMGYTEALSTKAAEAMADNNIEEVMNAQKEFNTEREKLIKAEMLKKTPTPPAGSGNEVMTKEKFIGLPTDKQLEYTKDHPNWQTELK